MSENLTRKTFAIFATDANRRLIAELKNHGEVIELPDVSAVKTAEFESEINPTEFDWIIFTDVFAADFFLEKLSAQGFEFYELDAVRICAFGEAVSDRLRFVQVHADVIPSKIDDESIISALKDYIFCDEDFAGLRFLIIKESSAEHKLNEVLRESEAEVSELSLHYFQVAETENLTKIKTLIKGGAADEFIFTTPFDATALRFLFDEKLSILLAETQISATDEITFQTLSENGLRPLYFRKP